MTINDIINDAFKICHDTLDSFNLPYNIWCDECPGKLDCEVTTYVKKEY